MVASYVEKLPFFLFMYYKNSFHYNWLFLKILLLLYKNNAFTLQ